MQLGTSPFVVAVSNNDAAMVQLLSRSGADIDKKTVSAINTQHLS